MFLFLFFLFLNVLFYIMRRKEVVWDFRCWNHLGKISELPCACLSYSCIIHLGVTVPYSWIKKRKALTWYPTHCTLGYNLVLHVSCWRACCMKYSLQNRMITEQLYKMLLLCFIISSLLRKTAGIYFIQKYCISFLVVNQSTNIIIFLFPTKCLCSFLWERNIHWNLGLLFQENIYSKLI